MAISADGRYVVVGAPFDDANAASIDGDPSDNTAESTGAVFLFDRAASWSSRFLKSSVSPTPQFLGYSVDVSDRGGTIVAGAVAVGGRGAFFVFD